MLWAPPSKYSSQSVRSAVSRDPEQQELRQELRRKASKTSLATSASAQKLQTVLSSSSLSRQNSARRAFISPVLSGEGSARGSAESASAAVSSSSRPHGQAIASVEARPSKPSNQVFNSGGSLRAGGGMESQLQTPKQHYRAPYTERASCDSNSVGLVPTSSRQAISSVEARPSKPPPQVSRLPISGLQGSQSSRRLPSSGRQRSNSPSQLPSLGLQDSQSSSRLPSARQRSPSPSHRPVSGLQEGHLSSCLQISGLQGSHLSQGHLPSSGLQESQMSGRLPGSGRQRSPSPNQPIISGLQGSRPQGSGRFPSAGRQRTQSPSRLPVSGLQGSEASNRFSASGLQGSQSSRRLHGSVAHGSQSASRLPGMGLQGSQSLSRLPISSLLQADSRPLSSERSRPASPTFGGAISSRSAAPTARESVATPHFQFRSHCPNLDELITGQDACKVTDWFTGFEQPLSLSFPDARCPYPWLDPVAQGPDFQVLDAFDKPWKFADFKEEWDHPDLSNFSSWLEERTSNHKQRAHKSQDLKPNSCHPKRSIPQGAYGVLRESSQHAYMSGLTTNAPLQPEGKDKVACEWQQNMPEQRTMLNVPTPARALT